MKIDTILLILIILVTVHLMACKPPTPAQEVSILKGELSVVNTKCAIYTGNAKYPRDTTVTERCDKLLK